LSSLELPPRHGKFRSVSANEIIAELPKLNRQDLERLDARLHQLLNPTESAEKRGGKPIGQVMLEFAGKAQGLPEDYSANIDHYLHGVPKRQS
jgi:hypothetical protein